MWITVLALAIAVNFEPMRLGLITIALSRPRPVAQLIAFLCAACTTSLGAGLLVLLIIHHRVIGDVNIDGSAVQIVLGVLILLLAGLLATNISIGPLRRKLLTGKAVDTQDAMGDEPRLPGVMTKLSTRTRGLLQGSSPWFSAAMGLAVAIPSVDYIALLILIATSGSALTVQIAALVTFVVVANAVVGIPIASFLLAPEKTRSAILKLRAWIAARSRRDFAMLLAVAGCIMIAVGVSGL